MTDPHPMAEVIKALYAPSADDMPACEHCDADDELIEVAPGVLILEIRHDDGCPVLARHHIEFKS